MPLKCTGKTTLLFVYFLILKKQYNSKTKPQIHMTWHDRTRRRLSLFKLSAESAFNSAGVFHGICHVEAAWRTG